MVAPDFEHTDLAEQITDLVDKMLEVAGLDVHIDITRLDESRLDEQQKLAVYRIAQEQSTNIVKYARAKRVTITFNTAKDLFSMTITDDGIGMEANKKTKGIGLKNIIGRLSVFNGNVNIKTTPGKGFSLMITMPLQKSKG